MIEIGLVIFPLLILLVTGQLLLQLGANRLPASKVKITEVGTQKSIRGNLVELIGWVAFVDRGETRIEKIRLTERVRNEQRIDEVIEEIKRMRGSEVTIRRVPHLGGISYLDAAVFRKPAWPGVVLLVVLSIILFALYQI